MTSLKLQKVTEEMIGGPGDAGVRGGSLAGHQAAEESQRRLRHPPALNEISLPFRLLLWPCSLASERAEESDRETAGCRRGPCVFLFTYPQPFRGVRSCNTHQIFTEHVLHQITLPALGAILVHSFGPRELRSHPRVPGGHCPWSWGS